ncbi:hypothetical protein RRG08_036778 [Elysia crispata]|uniref:Uncharacterized protein n=1 Tax=Elysia crispata TaxID=231223 RepID=A0AAE1ACS8_9GAST|nr:hypothetical protein RRG08_036778 [Elysia crispata]
MVNKRFCISLNSCADGTGFTPVSSKQPFQSAGRALLPRNLNMWNEKNGLLKSERLISQSLELEVLNSINLIIWCWGRTIML